MWYFPIPWPGGGSYFHYRSNSHVIWLTGIGLNNSERMDHIIYLLAQTSLLLWILEGRLKSMHFPTQRPLGYSMQRGILEKEKRFWPIITYTLQCGRWSDCRGVDNGNCYIFLSLYAWDILLFTGEKISFSVFAFVHRVRSLHVRIQMNVKILLWIHSSRLK